MHGLAGSSRWWRPVLDRLADRRNVRLLDVPRRVQPDAVAAWLADELRALGTPVDLAAHSLGAAAAIRVAASQPELLRRLVLISPVGLPLRRGVVASIPHLAATILRSRRPFVPLLVADALRSGPRNLLRGGVYGLSADLRPDVGSIRAPTLLVWGERDGLVPFGIAAEWEQALPNARLVTLPRAGHVAMFDAPEQLAGAIVEFLDEAGDLARV